jgi:L-asparaginase
VSARDAQDDRTGRRGERPFRGAFLNLGGTIGEIHDGGGGLQRTDAGMLLAAACLPANWGAHEVHNVDSVDMTFAALFAARDIIAHDTHSDGFVMCCGTDLLDEIAFTASSIIPHDRPVVLTAASQPYSATGSDGPANLQRAAVLAAFAQNGFHVVMGDMIFDPQRVTKFSAQALQPFDAFDGPTGRFRADLPILLKSAEAAGEFADLRAEDCTARVGIMTMGLGAAHDFIDPQRLDGLVVAAAGAGGISETMRDMLRRDFLPRMPVVLSTRCPFGFAINPAVAKYAMEGARHDGFLLDGYTHLNAAKARIRLILEIGRRRRVHG